MQMTTTVMMVTTMGIDSVDSLNDLTSHYRHHHYRHHCYHCLVFAPSPPSSLSLTFPPCCSYPRFRFLVRNCRARRPPRPPE